MFAIYILSSKFKLVALIFQELKKDFYTVNLHNFVLNKCTYGIVEKETDEKARRKLSK